jgi:protoporphyrinogen oxidase
MLDSNLADATSGNGGQEAPVAIIGAGPAGLTAAYALMKAGRGGVIVEADGIVGGIARTVERDGYRFDIGGHRFFTKVGEIEKLWDEMLGEPMLVRPRMSRIYYGGKFYDYPLRSANALRNMGLLRAADCMLSYAKARLRPNPSPANYQEWVIDRFGEKLFHMFFKSYTEKVWGLPCTEIGAEWAAQRIKGLSLGGALRNAVLGWGKSTATTLIDRFHYPRLGPGQLWESAARTVQAGGWDLRLNRRVAGIRHGATGGGRRIEAVAVRDPSGRTSELAVSHLFSSMPLRELLRAMAPPPPAEVLEAADGLKYRDFLTVVLVLDAADVFPDNWIYVHAPEVRMGRIQNYKNWSPEMVPDATTTCLGLEYFVNEGDELWAMADDDLVRLGHAELETIGLAEGALVKGYVVRMPKAYPVYDIGFQQRLDIIRNWLEGFDNLVCIGRNGQHRYNNQDHSMATALIAVSNLVDGDRRDPWAVNEDAEYHEAAATERQAPLVPGSGSSRQGEPDRVPGAEPEAGLAAKPAYVRRAGR